MAGISPVPTGRVSDMLLRNRLTAQMRVDQQDLFRIQQQISTGRRIAIPSEDAPAAVRAIGLQRLVEQKNQMQTNLATSESYLTATDTALSDISGSLATIRGLAVSVSGTTSTDEQRNAVNARIQQTINDLVIVGNQKFRGRYLFAGSNTTEQPFLSDGNFVQYNGDESTLSTYADIDLLFETSVHGNQVFGAISEPVRGTTDLQPILKAETRLSDLRGGQGVSRGSISISDGVNSNVVDLSGAATIGDVAAMIEANPPTGRTVRVDVTSSGMRVTIDTAGGGNLLIDEVGGGTTAAELGILNRSGTGTTPITGDDLNPALKLTTSLQDITGVRAKAFVTSSDTDNDLIFEAVNRGGAYNQTTIQFVDDALVHPGPGLAAGNETVSYSTTAVAARASLAFNNSANNDILLTATTAGTAVNNTSISITTRTADAAGVTISYDANAKTYSISVEENVSTAADVRDAILAHGTGGGPFTATLDTSVDATNDGSYVLQNTDGLLNAGNTGNSGGENNTLFVSIENGATTSEHVVNAVTADATVSQLFTAKVDTKDDSIKINSGTGAVDINATAQTSGGSGVNFDQDSGLQIVNATNTYAISFTGAETIEDLLNRLNGSDAGVLAEINSEGTGINIRSRVSGTDFSIGENGGITATQLGVRSITVGTDLSELNHGQGVHTETGNDFTIRRSDGIELAIDLSDATTVGQVFDVVNNHPDNTGPTAHVTARLSAFGNGIEIVEENPSAAGSMEIIRENLSLAGEHLGLIPNRAEQSEPATPPQTATATLSLTGSNNDLLLTAKETGIALNDVTIQIVNTGAATGNAAIVTYDDSDLLAKTLTIDIDPASTTANTVIQEISNNGAVPFSTVLSTTDDPTNDGTGLLGGVGESFTSGGGIATSIITAELNPLETSGIFNSLTRLSDALESNDPLQITRAIELLDADAERMNLIRADLGARHQGLTVLSDRVTNEVIELTSVLSVEIDVDLASAISEMVGRQAAFEASMQMSARAMQVSLMDFL